MRAKSARELFRDDFNEKRKAMGEKINPCSKDAWDRVKREWEALAGEQKELWEEEALAGKQAACRARAQNKAGVKQKQVFCLMKLS